jgi:hypothetical protein
LSGKYSWSERLLVGISRLNQFTVSQIAEYAQVSLEETYSFLQESLADVERGSADSRISIGGSQWRLRPEREISVAVRVADLCRMNYASQRGTARPMSNAPSTLQLLEATLLALESGTLLDGEERR